MPPAAKVDLGIIFFDLRCPHLLPALLKFLAYKHANSKDLYSLMLVNSEDTNNPKDAPNISFVKEDVTVVDAFAAVEITSVDNEAQFNMVHVLVLGVSYLKRIEQTPGLVTKQLIIFSDLEDTVHADSEDKAELKNIVDKMVEMEIYLYFVGPHVKLTKTLMSTDDIYDQNLKIDETKTGQVLAKEVVVPVDGILADANVSLNLLTAYTESHGSQPWKVPLAIGKSIKVPVYTVKVYRQDKKIKMKKRSLKNIKYCLAEDRDVEVPFEETLRGITLHNRFFRMDDKVGKFKFATTRGFNVKCFVPADQVPEVYFVGGESFMVSPLPEASDKAKRAFYRLVETMGKQRKYAIVERIYNSNNKPKPFVLIADEEDGDPVLTMTELANGEDIKVKRNVQVVQEPIKEQGDDAETDEYVDAFLKSIDVTNPDCCVNVPLAPPLLMNLKQNKIVNAIVHKRVNIPISKLAEYDCTMESKENLPAKALKSAMGSNQNSLCVKDGDLETVVAMEWKEN